MLTGESALIMNYFYYWISVFVDYFCPIKWSLKKTLQVLSGETAWVLTDHLASAAGFQKKVQDKLVLHFVQKYETLSDCAAAGELSVIAGQQVELLETREEEVSNSILNDYYLQ